MTNNGTPSRGGRRWVAPAAGIGLIALAVRVLYLAQTGAVPFVRTLIGDAAGYYAWAGRIAGGEWVGRESFYQAPLYPYALAVWSLLAGGEIRQIRVLQAVWGAAACVLLYLATERTFGRRAGVVAGLMLSLYGPAIFFDGIVQKAALGNLLVCALLAAVAWVSASRRASAALVLGVVSSLLTLTRENAMLWQLVLLWWMVAKGTRDQGSEGARGELGDEGRWRAVVGYVAGAGLILAPVAIRNAAVSGEWSVTTFQAGPNFYIGNHSGADGRYQPLIRGHETPEFERTDAALLAQEATGRAMSAREVSRYWARRAWGDIAADPAGWLELMGRKTLMVLNRYEVSDAEGLIVYRGASGMLDGLCTVWHFGVLAPLAAAGVAATWGERRRLWVYHVLIVSMAGAVAAFYVLARYRYPLVPPLMMFAAAGAVGLWDRIGALRTRRQASSRCRVPDPTHGPREGAVGSLVRMCILAIVVAFGVNWRVHEEGRLDALVEMNAGVALAQGGDVVGATKYFRRAVAGHPASAEANNNLALALALQGDFAGAIPHYQAALAAARDLVGVDFNLAVALEHVGRREEALKHYRRAVERDPGDEEARRAVERMSGPRE